MDPTPALITAASKRDEDGKYIQASAERLPFGEGTFDTVLSYLSLIDIPNAQTAIQEMVPVLKPGGAVLIANLTSFNTACADISWVKDQARHRLSRR
jgi:ubiquinone/menaquinone biosynthesis C-methylase UbiE